MKKTVFQIAVAVMLLLMGCSKDEPIGDTSEKNQFKSGRGVGWNFTEFYGTSTGTDYLTICLLNGVGEPENCGRKLLTNGYFSGNLPGYGKINPKLSKYTIGFVDPSQPSEYFTLYGDEEYYASFNDKSYTDRIEPYFYNIVISGTVALSTNDSFRLTVTAELSPMMPLLDINTGITNGSRFGTHDVVISDRIGKFKNSTQIFYNCGTTQISDTNFNGANLEGTGAMSIYVNNVHF